MMKKIVLFGASGNIGAQSIEVLKQMKNRYELIAISIGLNDSFLEETLNEFNTIKKVYSAKKLELESKYPNVEFIYDDITKLVDDKCTVVLNALSGFFGLKVTIKAIEKNKLILLANKESLVTGGGLINNLLDKHKKAKIYPIDSEHCAIWQCLENNKINKLFITASGGAFINMNIADTKNVTREMALKHPNWTMGNKITIDSSTMFNKAFEILEAYHLFKTNKIEVLVHPQSLIHSMVEFEDKSIKAQISAPDMKTVIAYFLNYPVRKNYDFKQIDFSKLVTLDLKLIDQNRFKPIKMAFESFEYNSKAIAMNAANEVCVEAFLNNKISFYDITEIVENIFKTCIKSNYNNYDDIFEFDSKIRNETKKLIGG